MLGVPVIRFSLKIQVWYSGLVFNLGFWFRNQAWDAEFGIQV